VITLADITNATGDAIDGAAFKGKKEEMKAQST
jgi:hypothetical protein